MHVSNVMLEPRAASAQRFPESVEELIAGQQHTAREQASDYDSLPHGHDSSMMDVYPSTETSSAHDSLSPTKHVQPKHVSFELLLPQSPQHRARLPMRVNIYPHDTTDSIITTVKNFYGLYERRGVIFEDRHGTTLIARFENFEHGMVVYVRVSAEELDAEDYSPDPRQPTVSPRRPRPHLDEAFQMLPPAIYNQANARADSRNGRRTHSPQPGRGRRSASASTHARRSRPAAKSRGNSSHGSFAEANGDMYSDSDGGEGSVTSSRRSRKEPLASADISVDNIVEGGRRKRAKFDSSELPLFVPPQVPMTTSQSSVSPQRRVSGNTAGSPYSMTNQHTFSYQHPLPSPQSYGQADSSYMHGLATPYSASSMSAQGQKSRNRGSGQYGQYRHSGSNGVVPTPEHAHLASVSVISDEDVARQLMRLGDASNFSTHGRTSTSTLDDAFSGKADAPSSSEDSDDGSDDGGELPPLPYSMARLNHVAGGEYSGESSDDYDDNRDGSFKGESDEMAPDEHSHRIQAGLVKVRSSVSSKSSKPAKARTQLKSKTKTNGTSKPPMSPTSLPTQSRKTSSASINFQHQLGADEEDLSSKPRCQRCRKSKKGCDRQRPCQRCKDAGIGADGCVSEDEGNGRKGRYGRHMGVSVKKPASTAMAPPPTHDLSMAMDTTHAGFAASAMDKSKKRKR
ncbi:hypothetical protein ACEQ8H_002231 [Pleosporales sp. CAS-2024a]